MNVLNSPGRNRSTGMTSMHEVKSGIFLSDIKGGAGDLHAKKTMKVVRTKSGNFKKAMESELDGEKDFAGDAGTRVTSSYARVLLAGSGFLADAYDLFVINLVLRLLRNEYPEYGGPAVAGGVSLHALEGGVAAAALVGSIIGQLVAGTLADVIGRKKIFVTTAVLISIGSFGSACCANWPTFTVYGQLACWRFLLGIGVGGEYPLAATVTSESSSAAKRGRLMAGVFSMQGVGSLLSVVIVVLCLSLGCSDGFTWRFALAFGALPVLIAFPFRLRMHETESFQRVKQERAAQAVLNKETQEVIRLHNIEAPVPNYGSVAIQGSPQLHFPSGKMKCSGKHMTSNKTTHDRDTEMMHVVTDCVVQDDYLHSSENNSTKNTNKPTPATTTTNNNNTNQFFFPVVPTSNDPLLSRTKTNTSTTTNTTNTTSPLAETPIVPTRMSEIHKAFKYYKFHMLGTALCWFLLDVDFYANGLFNHEITSSIFSLPGQRNTALQDAYYTGLLALIGIPGYWLSVFYIDAVGRKNLQMMGFSCMAGLFFVCAVAYEWLMDPTGSMYRKYLFLLIYALTFLFSNFGPNTTTFVIPGEIFPAEVRATCHGISAASGKLGAATGAFFFPHLLGPDGATAPTTAGIRLTMLVCGIVAVLGVGVTYLFIPTYDASMLVQEGNYLALDHAFLRPCDDDLMLLDGYECVEVEDPDFTTTNTASYNTSSDKDYEKGDSATVSDNTNGLESGVSDRSGKFVPGSFVTSNNTSNNSSNAKNSVPMKHVVAHHDGYNQLQGRDELY